MHFHQEIFPSDVSIKITKEDLYQLWGEKQNHQVLSSHLENRTVVYCSGDIYILDLSS